MERKPQEREPDGGPYEPPTIEDLETGVDSPLTAAGATGVVGAE